MKKIVLLIFLITLLKPIQSIKAESGLEISPAINSLVLKPGETYTGNFKISNNNEFDVNLEASKGLKNLDNTVSVDSFENRSTEWVNLDINNTRIKSLTDQIFNYSINIPKDASEGIYNPMLIFKLSSNQEESGSATALTQLLPFQLDIFVTESGVYTGNINITNLSVEKTILIGSDQLINFTIENTNVSPSKPLIRVQIVSPDNDIIYQSVQNESLSYVVKSSPYNKILELSESFKTETKFGRYSVELLVTDTLTNQTKTQRVYFWFIPQTIIFIIICLIIFLVIVFALILKFKFSSKVKVDKHLFMYK